MKTKVLFSTLLWKCTGALMVIALLGSCSKTDDAVAPQHHSSLKLTNGWGNGVNIQPSITTMATPIWAPV